MKITSKRRSLGFTLIEALITISIVSILASIAIPSFIKIIESNRISSASNEFLSALMLARSEAAKRSISVGICTSSNGSACNSANDYAQGWIVFTDCNDDSMFAAGVTACDLDGDGSNDPDLILRVQQPIKSVSIIGSAAATKNTFSYRFSGRPSTAAGFSIGAENKAATKKINVARTGRVRLENL